ncbi:hypothetical protein [Streptomyces sp. NPDC005533]|uniref:hypothetical protein n=1 Tax=Streptomyces sp. NPDC005533 TaxID=3364723 RepID=UPI00367B52D8
MATHHTPRGENGSDGTLIRCQGTPACGQEAVLEALGMALAPRKPGAASSMTSSSVKDVSHTAAAPAGPSQQTPRPSGSAVITSPRPSPPTATDWSDDSEATETPPGLPVIGSTGWRYEADEHGGTVWKVRRGKEVAWEVVLDWAPYVSERLVVLGEDGKSAGRYYTITIGADTLTKSLSDLRTADGWNDFSDDSGAASRTTRDVLINIITDQGKRLPRIPVVTHTGWHKLPDAGLTYVFADARTYPSNRLVRLIGAPPALRRAAEPLDCAASDSECRQAIEAIATHGWAPMMALAVGARAMAHSLRPLSATFVFDAEPNSGKTSAANTGRSLLLTPRPHSWPPIPTKGMNSTVTDIECALDFEGDMPILLDDIPLTRVSSASEVREMEKKLELVIRAAGNATEIKGRRNRDLTAKPGNQIRSIPVIAAQMLPPAMQESLYRRSVVAYLSREGGEVDWRWYKNGGGESLTKPLRTIGERIIAHLYEQGEQASGYLEHLEQEAARQLTPHINKALPERSDTMEGVITAAAAMLSGLGLVAAATGLRMSDLTHTVAAPLAASLARQASVMDERSTAQGGVATAVGEALRKALFQKRAHVRDAKGVARPAVPGHIEQDQGLMYRRETKTWDGRGPALYWLPGRGPALGITSRNLNMLLKASGDPRVNSYVDRSLPEALLQAGALHRNLSQKDRIASHRVRVGADNLRLLLLKPELIWDVPS